MRLLRRLTPLAAALLASAAVAQDTEPSPGFTPLDAETAAAEVERINAYVREIDTIEGRFIQTATNGQVDEGRFYWRRPDRLRIEYDTNPLLIVADGDNIAQIDRDLESFDQVRIGWTPYKFLLDRNFDLDDGAELVAVRKAGGQSFVTVRDLEGRVDGEFTLVFAEPSLEFRGWLWRTPYDGGVDFFLSGVEAGGELDPRLFVTENPREERSRRRDRR